MADFIDREKIRNEVCDGCTHRTPDNGCGWPEPCNRLIAGFVSAPAADVAPVVRCRECKHWGGVDEYGDGYCKNPDGIDNIAKEYDFCSYGEKAN